MALAKAAPAAETGSVDFNKAINALVGGTASLDACVRSITDHGVLMATVQATALAVGWKLPENLAEHEVLASGPTSAIGPDKFVHHAALAARSRMPSAIGYAFAAISHAVRSNPDAPVRQEIVKRLQGLAKIQAGQAKLAEKAPEGSEKKPEKKAEAPKPEPKKPDAPKAPKAEAQKAEPAKPAEPAAPAPPATK